MGVGSTVLRVAVGGVFVAHGLQKLRGMWDGPGLEGTEKMVASMDMHPAPLQARAVALAETVGGAAIVLGIGTPVAAAALIATMVTAVRKVHWKNGFFNGKGGYEFNTVLTAGLIAIVADGPGVLSVDAIAGKRRGGFSGVLFAVGAGVAGSFLATELGRKLPVAEKAGETTAE